MRVYGFTILARPVLFLRACVQAQRARPIFPPLVLVVVTHVLVVACMVVVACDMFVYGGGCSLVAWCCVGYDFVSVWSVFLF